MMNMERTDSSAAMASLAMYAGESDSDEEGRPKKAAVDVISDEENETPTPTPYTKPPSRPPSSLVVEDENSHSDVESTQSKTKKKLPKRLVSYGADELEDEEGEESSPDSPSGNVHAHLVEGIIMNSSLNVEQASSLSRSMLNKSIDEIELPPEPPTKCPKHLQDKITKLYDKMRREGLNLNYTIQKRVDFRNPSIYEKLIEFCGIDEKGTNYPPELYDPYSWGKESYYDALEKTQKTDMEKREKERKERTKIEFVMGTKKSASKSDLPSLANSGMDEKRRKTKWDNEPSGNAQAGNVAAAINKSIASLTASSTGSKSTVIPATGTISKKPGK